MLKKVITSILIFIFIFNITMQTPVMATSFSEDENFRKSDLDLLDNERKGKQTGNRW